MQHRQRLATGAGEHADARRTRPQAFGFAPGAHRPAGKATGDGLDQGVAGAPVAAAQRPVGQAHGRELAGAHQLREQQRQHGRYAEFVGDVGRGGDLGMEDEQVRAQRTRGRPGVGEGAPLQLARLGQQAPDGAQCAGQAAHVLDRRARLERGEQLDEAVVHRRVRHALPGDETLEMRGRAERGAVAGRLQAAREGDEGLHVAVRTEGEHEHVHGPREHSRWAVLACFPGRV